MVFYRKTKRGKTRISNKKAIAIKRKFQREYGKKRGSSIFYATFTKRKLYRRHRR